MRTGRARDRAEYIKPSSSDTASTVLPVPIEAVPSSPSPQLYDLPHFIHSLVERTTST